MIYFKFIDIKELKNRLSTLVEDVTLTSRDVFDLLNIISDTFDDKRKLLKDIYFNENSPLKIINTQFLPKGDGDTTGEMIDLSLGYDSFLSNINEKTKEIMKRHEEALTILITMLNLEEEYALLLFLRYFKRLTPEECWLKLHDSKATFFRKQNIALEKLRQGIIRKD